MSDIARELIMWATIVMTAINVALFVVQGTWGARVKALEADNDWLMRRVVALANDAAHTRFLVRGEVPSEERNRELPYWVSVEGEASQE